LAGGVIKLECVNDGQDDDEANGNINHPTLSADVQTAYKSIDFDSHTEDIITYTYQDYTYEIDANKNTFKDNMYYKNIGTASKGIVTVINSPRTYFVNDYFNSNGDAVWETTYSYGKYVIADESVENYAYETYSTPTFD
jgi:hypothetical protein